MKSSIIVFYKTLVLEYYKQNALFILVVILFAFGFLSGREHITLINNALSSNKLLLYVFLLWFIHFLKTLLFVHRQLSLSQNYFLYNAKYLSLVERSAIFFYVFAMLSLLTSLYGIFMVVVGLKSDFYLPIFLIIIFHIFLILLGTFYFEKRIFLKPELESLVISKYFKLPYIRVPNWLFFHKHLIMNQSILFLITKISTLAIISFFVWLYPTDEYDYRLFSIMGVFVGVAHYTIAVNWVQFLANQMLFDKNLPISTFYRLFWLFIGICIILIPEYFFFVSKAKVSGLYFIEWVIFTSSIFLSVISIGIKNVNDQEASLKVIFWSFVIGVLLVMFKIPILLFCVFLLFISFLFYSLHFEKLES